MRKFIQNKLKDQKGLTLIELLAVIVILAIIAAIAIPAIGGIIENSRVGAMKSDNLNAISAAELYIIDNPDALTINLDMLLGSGTDTASTPTTIPTGAPSYLDDAGSLDDFLYTVSTNKATSGAQAGNMNMDATAASKDNFTGLSNSSRSTADPIKVSKD